MTCEILRVWFDWRMKETCQYCFQEKRNCVCVWKKCAQCGKSIPESHAYEYRGRIFCEHHDFEEQVSKRDAEREEVMRIVSASTESQRRGEFVNNRGKYHLENVAADGLPIMKIKEPQILKGYEGRD